jgi:hypothetical protein
MYIRCSQIQMTLKRWEAARMNAESSTDRWLCSSNFFGLSRGWLLLLVCRLVVHQPEIHQYIYGFSGVHIICFVYRFFFFVCILLHQFMVMMTRRCKWICAMHLFDCWCAWVDMVMTSVMKVRFGHVIFNIHDALAHMSLFECAWLICIWTWTRNLGIWAWGYYISALLHTSL